MDPRAWIVAVVFGLISGIAVGHFRTDRRPAIAILGLGVLIGVVAWVISPDSNAGPSLTAGGGTALIAAIVTARSLRQGSQA